MLKDMEEYVVAQRRRFHKIPELSLKEKETAENIRDELKKSGVSYEPVGEYGTVACIKGDLPGKTYAFRADIDALPIDEDTGLSFKSTHEGCMHACGHDGHIAILLAFARELAAMRAELAGTVYLCFQQAEEIAQGHEAIIAYLKTVGKLEAVISSHLWADIPAGKMALQAGAVMAGMTSFHITVTGKSCHGSRPDQGIDPINAGALIIGEAFRIKDREFNPLRHSTLSFGSFHSGTATNIIPDRAELGGTMRYFSDSGKAHLFSIVDRSCKAAEILTGAKVEWKTLAELPPVVNDAASVEKALPAAEAVFGNENVIPFEKIMGSDNYACYLQEFPGFYAFIGIRNEAKGIGYAHHSSKFDMDESALANAVRFYIDFIRRK
ncbi:amidohydrolase [Treponema socranskii subsp. socranskii VPI DR56BR1116 = ATCC 35536]|nr:amidohydrolase [Treponema socranskii subsp. socranskii VPI DR56BR1116 = ATCC 35536]